MSARSKLAHTLSRLVTASLAGELTDGERSELDDLVCQSPEALDYYVHYMQSSYHLHCWSQSQLAAESLRAAPAVAPPVGWTKRLTALLNYHNHPLPFAVLVAIITTVSIVLTLRQIPRGEVARHPAALAPEGSSVAPVTFVRSVGARWGTPWGELQPGATLPAGQVVKLARGWAKFRFASGAQVVLQGPAVWQIEQPNRCRLELGRLAAQVPPEARGFAVVTPVSEVIDRGTAFGLLVREDGATEVHTFEGRTETKLTKPGAASAPVLSLRAGEAVRIAAGGERWTAQPADAEQFAQQLPGDDRLLTLTPVADARIVSEQGATPDASPHLLAVFSMANLRQRSLLKFDLSALPAGQKIVSAHLRLYRLSGPATRELGGWNRLQMNPTAQPMEIFRLTRRWDEATVNWLRPSADAKWDRAGGDAVGTGGLPLKEPYATASDDPASGQPVEWDVTELVQAWLDGEAKNHGLLLISHTGNLLHFHSSETPDPTLTPQLEVVTAGPR